MTSPLRTSPYTERGPEAVASERYLNGAAGLSHALLEWYAREQRQLPWRSSRDPYCIWVSEIMLQQTQVATVVGYYERWIERFPSVAALAAADMEDVLHAWQGLGYYSRAKNLKSAARQVMEVHDGRLPESIEGLRRLPGIGPYSAGAIASIAFGADEPAVDGNIIRVLTRLFCLSGDPKRSPLRQRLWEVARALIPPGRAGDFNQALMELGATRCTPRAPSCNKCPVAPHCQALEQDRIVDFPETLPRPAPTFEQRVAAVVRRRGRVLLVRAPVTAARWAGMWQFPDVAVRTDQNLSTLLARSVEASTGVVIETGEQIGSLRHHVTRFRIVIDVYSCRARGGRARAIAYGAVRWCPPEGLSLLAMPAAHRKIARDML